MHIKVLKEMAYKLENGSTRTLPVGWAGEVPDKVAEHYIEEGFAEKPGAVVADKEDGEDLDDGVSGEPRQEGDAHDKDKMESSPGSTAYKALLDRVEKLEEGHALLSEKVAALLAGATPKIDPLEVTVQEPVGGDLPEDGIIPDGIKPDSGGEEHPVVAAKSDAHADFADLTIAELKIFLDGENVKYTAKASHAALVDLCVKALEK